MRRQEDLHPVVAAARNFPREFRYAIENSPQMRDHVMPAHQFVPSGTLVGLGTQARLTSAYHTRDPGDVAEAITRLITSDQRAPRIEGDNLIFQGALYNPDDLHAVTDRRILQTRAPRDRYGPRLSLGRTITGAPTNLMRATFRIDPHVDFQRYNPEGILQHLHGFGEPEQRHISFEQSTPENPFEWHTFSLLHNPQTILPWQPDPTSDVAPRTPRGAQDTPQHRAKGGSLFTKGEWNNSNVKLNNY